tara:strand:- start:4170 stop:4898 length:729 start_codon:yes stop_codon:yes gene_type:complete
MHKYNLKNVCAIILCGGKGTRLGSVGKKINKTLIKYKGNPLIYHIIKYLYKFKINKILIPYGYRGEDIKKYIFKKFNSKKILPFNAGVNTSIDKRIKKSLSFIEKNYEYVIILNGDSFYNFNLNKVLNSKIIKKKTLINLVCTKLPLSYGFVEKKNNKIDFVYKRKFFQYFLDSNSIKNYFYSGICIINKEFLKKNINKIKKNFEVELFNKASKLNKLDYIYDNNSFFQINYLKDLKSLTDD